MGKNDVDQGLKGLELISQTVGRSPDMVQGGGGNTSAKLDEKIMAIKASGYRLSQVTRNRGHVLVNYKDILDFYKNTDFSQDKDFAGKSKQVIKNSIVENEGQKLKPSVETGFHSFMKKYVIHTHSVYANILCCAEEGEKLVNDIFENEDNKPVWLSYTHPGFYLTRTISEVIASARMENKKSPDVFFLQNHGLVVTGNDAQECIALNSRVNNRIKVYFKIEQNYPQTNLEEDDNKFISQNNYLRRFFRNNRDLSIDFFKQFLYPDQIVYMGEDISLNGSDSKINIDTDTGEIKYRTGFNEAQTIDEIMTAFLFIIEQIEQHVLTLRPMETKYIDLIKHMEDEDYRKKIMKNM